MTKVIAVGTVQTEKEIFPPGSELDLKGDDLKRCLNLGAVRYKTQGDKSAANTGDQPADGGDQPADSGDQPVDTGDQSAVTE